MSIVTQRFGSELDIDDQALQAIVSRLTDSGTGSRAKARYSKRRAWVISVIVATHKAGYDIVPRFKGEDSE